MVPEGRSVCRDTMPEAARQEYSPQFRLRLKVDKLEDLGEYFGWELRNGPCLFWRVL